MRVAILDLGTNTFNLLIRNTETQELLHNSKISVKLGEGGIDQNLIQPEPFQRGIDALKQHVNTIKNFNVAQVYAFATSAIRSSSNGPTFINQAKQKAGIEVNVIDGQKEAELIYHGVKQAVKLGPDVALIMDIGGGSTEFIFTNHERVLWKESYPLGASRLKETFKPSDPIGYDDIQKLTKHFDSTLEGVITASEKYHPTTLIGSSGSFDTLADMIAHEFDNGNVLNDRVTYDYDLEQYDFISQKMRTSNLQERLDTPGMIPMRADMIVLACLQIDYILGKLSIQSMKLSTYALKEGVLNTLNQYPWQESLL